MKSLIVCIVIFGLILFVNGAEDVKNDDKNSTETESSSPATNATLDTVSVPDSHASNQKSSSQSMNHHDSSTADDHNSPSSSAGTFGGSSAGGAPSSGAGSSSGGASTGDTQGLGGTTDSTNGATTLWGLQLSVVSVLLAAYFA